MVGYQTRMKLAAISQENHFLQNSCSIDGSAISLDSLFSDKYLTTDGAIRKMFLENLVQNVDGTTKNILLCHLLAKYLLVLNVNHSRFLSQITKIYTTYFEYKLTDVRQLFVRQEFLNYENNPTTLEL